MGQHGDDEAARDQATRAQATRDQATRDQDDLRAHIERTRAALSALGRVDTDDEGGPAHETMAVGELEDSLEELEVTWEQLAQRNRDLADLGEALRRERQRYRDLFDLAPDAYVITDRAGLVIEANAQARRLLRVRTLAGRPLAGHVTPDDRPEFRRRLSDLADGGDLQQLEIAMQPADGAPLVVSVDAVAGTGPDGKPVVRWLLRDVTNASRARETLQQAFVHSRQEVDDLRDLDEWKNVLLAAAAHDLLSPLSVIETGAQTLLERDTLPAAARTEMVGRIASQARRLRRLLSDLLDLDRLTRGVIRAERSLVWVDEVVSDALKAVPLEDHPLEMDLVPVSAEVDPVRVGQIAMNLVGNAVNHTPAGTPIRVALENTPDAVVLTVEDRGPGVPDDLKSQMFAPFVTRPRHDKDQGGSGLGLSLVHLFASLHGGTVAVEDRPGGGARFAVRLPQ